MTVFSLGSVDTSVYTGTRADGIVSTNNGGSQSGKVMSTYNTERVTKNFAATHSSDISNIEKYLQAGKIPEAMEIYEELLTEAQEQFGAYSYSDEGLSYESIVDDAFALKSNTNLRFSDLITEDKHKPVVTGLLQGIPLVGLFFDSYSDAEALAKVSGIETRFTDKLAELFGGAASGAAAGAAYGLFTGGALSIPLALGGALLGAGQVIVKGILNKN